jgi:hypothetical protein
VVCVETDQEVNVVIRAADRSGDAAQAAHGASQVSVESLSPIGVDERLASKGAEDEVVMEREVGSHGW